MTEEIDIPATGVAGTTERVQTMHEDLRVEEREVGERPIADFVDVPFQPSTIRVPVRGEEMVVQRRTVVAREVVVSKQRVDSPDIAA
jgi:uncharacterized protein (TIGR02271 family)